MTDKISILGFPIDNLSMQDAMNRFDGLMKKDGLSLIVTANPEILNDALSNDVLAEIIKSADLVTADGMILVKVSKLKGNAFKERITGIDFAYNALWYCAENSKSVFFLGGKPGVAKEAAERLEKSISGLKIAGFHDGYYKGEEESSVVDEINQSGADFLCIGTGSPKQELFLWNNKDRLNAKVGVGIGGSFDVWSGNINRAPEFFIKHDLEWLYRLVKEPKRFKRMMIIPWFAIKAIFK